MRRLGVPLVTAVALVLAVVFVLRARPVVVFDAPGTFGPVQVVEQSDGLRALYIGGGRGRQSAAYPRFPLRLVLDYTRVGMIAPALAPPEGRLLFVGLGGGVMPRYVRQILPEVRIDAVEIDPVVVRAAEEWFGFRAGPATQVTTADGRPYVEAAAPASWDLIFLDAFSDAGVPRALTTTAFLEAVRRALASEGVVASNLHTSAPDYPSMVATYRAVFDEVVEIDVPGRRQRILLAASGNRSLERDALMAAARAWMQRVPPEASYDLAGLVEAGWRRPEPSSAPVLVDAAGDR